MRLARFAAAVGHSSWKLPDWAEVGALVASSHGLLDSCGVAHSYPLARFTTHADVACQLPFPRSLHVSSNYARLHHGGVKPRKLPNVNTVLSVLGLVRVWHEACGMWHVVGVLSTVRCPLFLCLVVVVVVVVLFTISCV